MWLKGPPVYSSYLETSPFFDKGDCCASARAYFKMVFKEIDVFRKI